MKFTVLTASSKEYQPLANLTDKTKDSYAYRHDYHFSTFTHKDTKRIAWERVEIWSHELELCDWLFFTGCDAAITNQDIKLESLIDDDSDYIFAVDGCGFQSDSWLMRNCESTRKMLDSVLGLGEKYYPTEQDAIQLFLADEACLESFLASLPEPRKSGGLPASQAMVDFYTSQFNKSPVRCKIVSQRAINSYPLGYYGFLQKPIPESWNPGDFVCHLPGKSLEDRLKIFRILLKYDRPGS